MSHHLCSHFTLVRTVNFITDFHQSTGRNLRTTEIINFDSNKTTFWEKKNSESHSNSFNKLKIQKRGAYDSSTIHSGTEAKAR